MINRTSGVALTGMVLALSWAPSSAQQGTWAYVNTTTTSYVNAMQYIGLTSIRTLDGLTYFDVKRVFDNGGSVIDTEVVNCKEKTFLYNKNVPRTPKIWGSWTLRPDEGVVGLGEFACNSKGKLNRHLAQ